MLLLESFWTKLTAFCGIFSAFSPLEGGNHQALFSAHPHATPAINAASNLNSIIPGGPKFRPPGVPDESNFTCTYPEMKGWEFCSTPWDRKCWLKETATGKRFDINTNYEDEMPIGVTRYYNISLEDSSWDADGLMFSSAKLFRREDRNGTQYPGPWIQACWGDRYVNH
jgi:hypothetical protein